MSKQKFIESCLSGEAFLWEIEDYIDEWHDSDSEEPIYSFLGLTEEEYGLWVENDDFLRYILFARENDMDVNDLIKDKGKQIAARSSSQEEAQDHVKVKPDN